MDKKKTKVNINTALFEQERADTFDFDDGWNIEWQSPKPAIIVKDEPKVKIYGREKGRYANQKKEFDEIQ
jgi:hypothetical protein